MASNLSSIIDTASITHTISNFKSITSHNWSTIFCAVNNKELKFQLGTCPKPEFYPDGVIICLRYSVTNEPTNLEYEVSILNETKEKCYTKYYQFNYEQKKFRQHRNVTNFMPYYDLIAEVNGFIPNNQLTLFCDIKILKCSQTTGAVEMLQQKNLAQPMLIEDIRSILTTGDYSDFVLVVGGKEFRVYKNILAARSSVFKVMLIADLEEKKKNRVEIIDVDLEVFEQLLSYIYSGTVDKLDEYALELFIAADKYQLDVLKSMSAYSLSSNLKVETVANILVLSDMHSAPELKANCIKFITTNATKVMATNGWKQMMKTRLELVAELYEDIAQAHSALL